MIASFVATFIELSGYFMLLPLLTLTLAQRGAGAAQVGAFSALVWVGVVLSTPVAGLLVQRLGLRRVFIVSGAVPLVCVLGFALTDAFVAWCVLVLVAGFGSGVRWVVAEALVVQLAPPARRGRVVGLFQTMIGSTFVIGPALLSLAGVDTLAVPLGFSSLLLAIGLACALAVPEAPPTPAAVEQRAPVWQIVRSAPALFIAGAVAGFFESGLNGVLPVLGLRLGGTPEASALLVAVCGAGSTLLTWPVGELADRFDHHRVIRTAAWCLLASTLVLPWADSIGPLLWALVFVWGGAGATLYTLVLLDTGRRLGGAALVNGAAVLVMSYTLGGALAPASSGLALELAGLRGLAAWLALVAALAVALGTLTARGRSPRS